MNKIRLSKEQLGKIAAGALFSGLFLYAYTVYFWLPTAKKITENTKKAESMAGDIFKAKSQKAKYKDLEARLVSLIAEKDAVQKKLPKERQLPDLLKTLTSLSAKYKVSIQGITPSGSTRGEYFTKAAYQISLTGDYHSLGRFLTALGLEERILTTENLTISGTPGGNASVSATFTLIAYQYNG